MSAFLFDEPCFGGDNGSLTVFVMLKRTSPALLLIFYFATCQVEARDLLDRYQFLEDRFRSDGVPSPFESRFFIDILGLSNKNVTEIIEEIREASDEEGTDAEKLQRVQDFIAKHRDTEQFVKIDANIGIPFPDFRLFGIRFDPNLRIHAGGGLLLFMDSQRVTSADVGDFVGSGVPDSIKQVLVDNYDNIDEGEDIIGWLIDNGHIGEEYRPLVGRYFMPEKDVQTPTIESYLKIEKKAGFFIDYRINDRWDGVFNLYVSEREDFRLKADAQTIRRNGRDLLKVLDNSNKTQHMNADYYLRYRNGHLRILAGVEEIEASEVSNNEEQGGALVYDRKPLARLHGDYFRRFGGVNTWFFLGVHGRKGYSFNDGLYAGTKLRLSRFKDRIALSLGLRLDREYASVSPGIRLWALNLGYTLKQPVTSISGDGNKLAAMHSVGLALAF